MKLNELVWFCLLTLERQNVIEAPFILRRYMFYEPGVHISIIVSVVTNLLPSKQVNSFVMVIIIVLKW